MEIRALVQQAENAEKERDYHAARRYYQRAVDESSDAVSAAFATRAMASALIFWGEYEGAMRLLAQSLRHDDEQPQAWHDLGVLRARAEDGEGARTALRRAVALAPEDPRPRIALAALLVKEGKYAAAREQYEQLLVMDIPPRITAAVRKALKILGAEMARPQAKPQTGCPGCGGKL